MLFPPAALAITFEEQSIADVFDITAGEAPNPLKSVPSIRDKLEASGF